MNLGRPISTRWSPSRARPASTLSQVLLGVRIACAECHHHPYDRWSQTDYFGMTAFFTPLSVKPSARGESVQVVGDPVTKHPRTGDTILPHALATKMPDGNRRPAIAASCWPTWMTVAETIRSSPATSPTASGPTSSAAAWSSRSTTCATPIRRAIPSCSTRWRSTSSRPKFDVKQLIRTIAASRTYQLCSKPNATNEKDELNYSRAALSPHRGGGDARHGQPDARRARRSSAAPRPARGRSSSGTAR